MVEARVSLNGIISTHFENEHTKSVRHHKLFSNVRDHSIVGLNNGDLLTIGGYDQSEGEVIDSIWRLSKGSWTQSGKLIEVRV